MRKTIVLLAALLIAASLGAQQLKIGTMDATALFGEPVLKVLKDAGIDATIVTFSQDVLIQELGKGGIDGAFFLAEPLIAQAKGAVRVPLRLTQTDFCAVSTDPSVKVANPGDLRKYAVGTVKGNAAHAAMTRGMKTVMAENDLEAFKLLAAGTVQVIIAVDKATPGFAATAGIKQFAIHAPPLLRTPTFLALSKANAGKKDAIMAVFKKWIENGQWEKELSAAEAKMKGGKR